MMWRLLVGAVLAALLWQAPAHAFQPSERLANPALEARAEAIGSKLRCLVCQNESIEESNAALAHDLRVLIRKRLLAGDSDTQVIDYMVSRYGLFVLLEPPFVPVTYLLWLGPPLLVGGAGLILLLRLRRRRAAGTPAAPPSPALTPEERARARLLLGEQR